MLDPNPLRLGRNYSGGWASQPRRSGTTQPFVAGRARILLARRTNFLVLPTAPPVVESWHDLHEMRNRTDFIGTAP
ncbi:MAG TPA: hypothetical protein VKU84_11735, partial [Stellaceae bacterium]|nr:hypothetical protein [Stellaceae bacterium]